MDESSVEQHAFVWCILNHASMHVDHHAARATPLCAVSPRLSAYRITITAVCLVDGGSALVKYYEDAIPEMVNLLGPQVNEC